MYNNMAHNNMAHNDMDQRSAPGTRDIQDLYKITIIHDIYEPHHHRGLAVPMAQDSVQDALGLVALALVRPPRDQNIRDSD